jgi:hypothetical protein
VIFAALAGAASTKHSKPRNVIPVFSFMQFPSPRGRCSDGRQRESGKAALVPLYARHVPLETGADVKGLK